jgi:MFS family permease
MIVTAGTARSWPVVVQAAAALAASMGIGRFAYAPILPLMHAQAGLSASAAAALATANYAGYLAGAVVIIAVPGLTRSVLALRASLLVLVGTVALMAAAGTPAEWFALRLAAGLLSSVVFIGAVSAMLSRLRGTAERLAAWGFGGVGAGIALSGAVVLVIRTAGTWRTAWLVSAALALALAAVAWPLRPADGAAGAAADGDGRPRAPRRWLGLLLVSYSLEGIGYIIAGTFLVAAVSQGSPGWAGSGAWILVGLAALPAPAVWAWLGRRWSRPGLLLAALLIQAAGIGLAAVAGGVPSALVSAALFGATFLGIVSIALALGADLGHPRALALLTAGYGIGQVLGPVIVTPVLHDGYRPALAIGAAIVAAAALAAAALRAEDPDLAGACARPAAGA